MRRVNKRKSLLNGNKRMACHINYDIYQYLYDIKDAQDFFKPHIFHRILHLLLSSIHCSHSSFRRYSETIEYIQFTFFISSCCQFDFSLSCTLFCSPARLPFFSFSFAVALISFTRSLLLFAIYLHKPEQCL